MVIQVRFQEDLKKEKMFKSKREKGIREMERKQGRDR